MENKEIKAQYGEFEITFLEGMEVWRATRDTDEVARDEKLSKLKEKLDRLKARENKFERIPVLFTSETAITDGTLTSVTDSGEGWVTFGNGRRAKMLLVGLSKSSGWRGQVYPATDANLEKRKVWQAMRAEMERIKKEAEALIKTLDVFSPTQFPQTGD